jgi:regulator of sigma E protease
MISIHTVQLIVEFAIGLVLLIFVHEFGHFIACRLLGIEVEEFGFGFPPRALVLFERGGTKFTLNWLPFGGFVRPKGETDPDVEGGLTGASPWKRIGVFLAGPIMNLLTAVALFIAAYAIIGSLPDRSRVQVAEVIQGLPAEQAGLQAGDILVSVDGIQFHSQTEVHNEIYSNLGKPLTIVYERNGELHTITITPLANPGSNGALGISMTYPMIPFNILRAIPEGFNSLYEYGVQLFASLGQIIKGQSNAADARPVGIKGMFDLYSYVREGPAVQGIPKLANVMSFFAIISFSLGFMNLLPIPPLDGGKIAFALPEIIIHKRIPVKYEVWVSSIAFFLLILLMIYINAQDFIHPINIPTPLP